MKLVLPVILAFHLSTAIPALFADQSDEIKVAVDSAVSERLLATAHQMIAEFKLTRYSHTTFIDRERSVCEVDCSGFLVTLLKQTSPKHLRQIATRHKRPLAEDFYSTFAAPKGEWPRGWKAIRHLQDVERGDIVAWIKIERELGDNTGHVMLVEEKPHGRITQPIPSTRA
jgi:hypothetical protein